MDRIIDKVNTPYYVLDEVRLEKNYTSLKNAFETCWDNVIIGYSFKTNSLPWLIDWMKLNGAYAEVVSETEYRLARELGYEKHKIILNGPYKGFEAMEECLNNGAIVNLDSFHEIQWLKNNKPNNGIWKVGLRINFDLESYCPNETVMGKEVGRFGFNLENGSFLKAIGELNKLPYVKIVGLHGHHSTKTKSLKIFKTICEKLVSCGKLINNQMEYVDIGGCLFGDKPGAPSFGDYAKEITSVLISGFDKNCVKLILEPGAALVASPFSYVCKVIDIKEVKDQRIVSTDGSCLHIDPQMHGSKFFVESSTNNKSVFSKQIISGYTCIEKDRMAILEDSLELGIDDYLIFYNTGAYSMSLAPLFIQYYPGVYVKNKGKFYMIRKPWGVKEYLSQTILGYKLPVEEE